MTHLDQQEDSHSARQTLEVCIARIQAENDKLHAVSELFLSSARTRADQLDKDIQYGKSPGPLHGVPILLKELVDISGYRTQFGSNSYMQHTAAWSAPIIHRLEAAGAIILGTTHMVEFAVGSWGTNVARGTPWNPEDREVHRAPGGSSSGSGVAVAADFAPIAFGSDTGGSIRIPAALCGVIGFKPSFGLIPLQGIAPTGPSFDTIGPLCKTVRDARRAVEAASGLSFLHPSLQLNEVTVAYVDSRHFEPIEPACLLAYQKAFKIFEDAGARLLEIPLPMSFVEFQKLNGDIVAFEAYHHLQHLVEDHSAPLDPFVRQRVLAGATISEPLYQKQLNRLSAVRSEFDAAFEGVDVMLLPGTPGVAPPLQHINEAEIPMSRYTRIGNCLNLCAIALPVPNSEKYLPVAIQLASLHGMDARLLEISEKFHSALSDAD